MNLLFRRSAPAVSASDRSPRPPLATWLFIGVMGATMAAVLTCTLLIERFVGAEARVQATQFLQTNADALRDALDRGMAQNVEEVRVMGQLDQVTAGTDTVAIRRALDQMHASFPQFAWLGLTGRDGKVVASVDGLLQGVDVSARPWFSGAQHGMFVGDVHSALLLAKLLPVRAEPWRFVDVATPVYAADGNLRGILGAHLSWSWAAQIKRELVDRVLLQHQAEALVVASDGTVLLGSPAWQGRKLIPADTANELSVESRTQGSGRYPGLGWNIVLRQPERVAMAGYRALQVRTHIAALALCLLFAPLLWLLAGRMATPLRELTLRLERDDDAELAPRRHPLYREADLLGQALDRHEARQREDAARLRELNASLEARVVERTAALAKTNDDLSLAVRERWHSEEHMRAVLTHAPDAYVAVDENGRVTEWNRKAEETLGWLRNDVLGMPLSELLLPAAMRSDERIGMAALTHHARNHAGAVSAGNGYRGEIDVLHQSGVSIPVDVSVATLRTDAGQVAYAFLRDISERKGAEQRLARSERRLRTVTDNMPALVSHIDSDLRYTFTNATYARWFGPGVSAMVGQKVVDVVGREVFERVEHQMRKALSGESCTFECDVRIDGREMHNLIHYIPDLDEAGAVQGLYGMVLDLTDRRAAELALSRSEQRLHDITNAMPGLIAYIDKDERYQFCNGTYFDWVGIAPADIVGRTMAETLGDIEYQKRKTHLRRALHGERTDFDLESTWLGVTRHLHTTYLPASGPQGNVDGAYVLVTDVSAMKAAEAKLALQARTDSLTGLPNRHAFNEILAAALARSRRNARPIALFFLDVDKFKSINDTLGHGAGDEVLKAFGQRLVASVRETDSVARLAGDEFVVVLEGLHTAQEPQLIALKILAAVSRPFEIDRMSLDVTTSIGIAYQADGRVQPAELLAQADKALYDAKAAGRNTFALAAA